MQQLIPYLEKKYRGLGEGWARFMYGGSTGGWEAMAAQVFYPDVFNGAYAACPDRGLPRLHDHRPLQPQERVLARRHVQADAAPGAPQLPGTRRRDGVGNEPPGAGARHQDAIGQQFDIWEAVYSPVGDDGYPARIFDKASGVIDRKVAEYWREHYDLVHILQRDWEKGLGKKLEANCTCMSATWTTTT